jgi:tetratricopeptide (TPR) repeat protein
LKWFLERKILSGENSGASKARVVLGTIAFGAATLTASASLIQWQNPGLLLGAGSSLARWLENAEAGSGVEKALYRLMKLPGGEALYRRSPREARPELTALIGAGKNSAALYSLRAMEDEKALDFDAAERDWKSWAQKAGDKPAANLDLADFYERRLKPQEELAALESVGQASASPRERWTASESRQSWKAWEHTLGVVDRFALPRAVAAREYAGWEQRYPQAPPVYERELAFDLAGKDFSSASALIARYRKAIPGDQQFPVRAEAQVEAGRGSAKDGLAVYDRSFEPLWPAELVKSYYDLLVSGRQTLKTRDALRARLAANPDGGADALKDAAKLFYIFQQQGQLEAAKAVLAGYRERKDARGAAWSADELYTLGRLLEAVQDFPEAARYYYALAANQQTPEANEKGLAGLARILLTAPEQPLRVGAGNLALYKSIATMDRGPGYLNGILSLFFNSQQPASEYSNQDQLAAPYFHRAKAAELVAEIDRRFPQSAERAELHFQLMNAYAAYAENDAVIREGTGFLAAFPADARRVEVALQVGDVYSRTNQSEKEFALYKTLLKELAAKADGVPLGEPGSTYSMPIGAETISPPVAVNAPADADADATPPQKAKPAGGARSAEYAQVLDRYLSRLVAMQRLPDALAVLRGELDRNPQDPGLYEKLASFLEQNRLNAHEEEVYQRAIEQFQDNTLSTGWYAKLARFYLRQRRNADYGALSRKVTGIFSGTDLEEYLRQAPAPDTSLALEVDRYAHDRFPHDLTFVRNLLAQYRSHPYYQPAEVEKLLWEHWAESADLRDQLFALLSSGGRLDAQLEALRRQAPEIDKADWSALAQSNPAAERFWLESCLWQSRYEDAVGAADALAAEYPADEALGQQASSLYRSLAYFHPEDTGKAVAIEKRLLSAKPDDLDRLARIGDIYADRGRMSEAAPYWTRMAEVHSGEADGYLQSATVFWDYFDFASASSQLRKARERLAQPALFGYEAGAIEESRGNLPGAIKEYVASSLGDKPSEESRDRLLTLARKKELRASFEAETAGLLKAAAPTSAMIELRVSLLDAEHRTADLSLELKQVVAQTESFDVLDAVTAAARAHALPEVEQLALRRQIALTTDPVRNLELRYQLVDLLQQRNPAAAASEVESIYREHAKVLGVVRATVDYNWAHERKPQAVAVLLESADAAYPELKLQFQLEAARKLTELGEYPRAKKLLEPLLSQKPLDATIEAALADNYARSGDQAGLASFYRAELAVVKASAMERGEKTTRLAQLRRGMIAAASLLGNWNEAADQYIELINAYPEDAALAQEAALVAGAHGQREKLLSFYRKTVEASPRDARWSIVLARLETALEDYPAAIEAYAKAIHVRPEQKDLYVSKADLEERLYKLDDAVADYDALYKLSYRDPQWRLKAAEARARQGRNADAVKALEEAWIAGRPPRATNFVEVATRLEQWGLLDEARNYAEQCVTIAGLDLLVEPGDQACALIYARIMARQRQSDAAFTRLAVARRQAENVPLSAVAEQVVKEGFGAITNEEWRRQRIQQRTEQAKSGIAQALRAMAAVAGESYTPEEKAQFSAWLQGKRSTAADGSELRAVYLPAIQAAGLADMEADLLWEFAEKSGDPNRGELDAWLQLQKQRVQLDGAGAKLEALAATLPAMKQWGVWYKEAEVDRTLGDSAAELRVMDQLAAHGGVSGNERPRYLKLLLAARPLDLVWLATNKPNANADEVAQFLVANGENDLALAGIAARSNGMPPVWRKAYTGLTGLYLREHISPVRASFAGALGGDATIGERIAHPADRDEQLAGEVWFYYGSRYGEYLDEEKDAQAEGYLESELEHTPESANAYAQLAGYSAQAGRADSALADYRHSLDLKSDQPAVLDSIAAIEWKQGRQADALATWQLAVKRLAAEMDARRVPESFWDDFALVLGDVAAHKQYAAIGEPVDAMLRIYLARNGEYRAEPLLEAGYHAHGDSMDWLLEITAAASDPASILSTIQQSNWQNEWTQNVPWIREGQMSRLLGRIAELERRKAQGKPEEYNWSLENAESRWITALLDEKKFAEARAELARIPEEKLKSSQWLDANLRLAEAEQRLPQLAAQWKKQPSSAPASSGLQNAVRLLSEPSKRIVMRFVYERALDARELTAPNFLGLAAIDLDEGDAPGALSLLKRLTLISGNPRADADSAASLLESHQKFSEAIQFLQPLAQSSPWDASLKIRLEVAMLAGDAHSQPALASLTSVAADPKATYAERLAAAKALKGHSAANVNLGSAELNLLTREGCPSEDETGKTFFIQARIAAAACTHDSKARERLLFSAIAASPGDTVLRLLYVSAAFAAGQNARALLAAESIIANGSFYGPRYSPEYNSYENENEDNESRQNLPSLPALKPEEANKLTWLAIRAREKRHESNEALTLVRSALSSEKDAARRHALEEEQKHLETEAARVAENAARAPNIHKDLDQDRVVRPRLLPGEPFVPRKTASSEEDAE